MKNSTRFRGLLFAGIAICGLLSAFALTSLGDSSDATATSFEVAVESVDSAIDLETMDNSFTVEDCIDFCKANPNCTPEECRKYCEQNCKSTCSEEEAKQCCTSACGKGC